MKYKKLRICLVIPSLGPGGMERVMSILTNYFSKKNLVEVHLVLYSRKREIFYSVPDSVIIHIPPFEFDNYSRALSTLKTLLFLRKKIKTINPDTILSFGENWNNLVLLSLFGTSFTVFVADRAEPGRKRKYIQELLSKWLYQNAKGIIVQTNKAKSIYQDIYGHPNIIAIGNPIRQICPQNSDEKNENIVLSVGRLVETKHFDSLIKIFDRVKFDDWKLIIVGGNAQRQNGMVKLRAIIKERNLENIVKLTGTVENVDVYYRRSKIFAFTSSSEGFPNVIGEALSAKLPVVAYDCLAGPSDMIEDGVNGFLIPLFDIDQFEEKLKLLMESQNLRLKFRKKSDTKILKFNDEKVSEDFFQFITKNI